MSSSNSDCSVPTGFQDLSIVGSQHKTILYIISACFGVVALSTIAQILLHFSHYSKPNQQRQIVRILFAPCVYALISWAEVFNYQAAVYIDPIGDWYEAFCLCAIYLLFIQFSITSTAQEELELGHSRAVSFVDHAKHNVPAIGWKCVFQYPLTELAAIIVLEATSATNVFCVQSLSPHYGHLWYELLSSIGVSICVVSILRFCRRNKAIMHARQPILKLVFFKLIVFLRFAQGWIFSALLQHNILVASDGWSYGDYAFGLPNLVLAAEMVLFSVSFWFIYPVSDYKQDSNSGRTLSFFGAAANALNPTDLLAGIFHAIVLFSKARPGTARRERRKEKQGSTASYGGSTLDTPRHQSSVV